METLFKLKPKIVPSIDNGGVVELEKVSEHPQWQEYLNYLTRLPCTFISEDHKNWYDVQLENEQCVRKAENSMCSDMNLRLARDNPVRLDNYKVSSVITDAVECICNDLKKNCPSVNPDSHDKTLFSGIPPQFFNGDNLLYFTADEKKQIELYKQQREYRKILYKRHCFIKPHISSQDSRKVVNETMRVVRMNQWLVARLNGLPMINSHYLEDKAVEGERYNMAFMKSVKNAA